MKANERTEENPSASLQVRKQGKEATWKKKQEVMKGKELPACKAGCLVYNRLFPREHSSSDPLHQIGIS